MSLIRSFATVSSLTLASRVLGFVRDILMAALIGAGWRADCFFVAFKFPNLFRRLFAEGAFNNAFVPLFTEQLKQDGDGSVDLTARAQAFARETLAVLLTALVLLVALFQIFMPWVILAIAPGFADEPDKHRLAADLAQMTFPYLLFISLAAFLGAMLNALGRFSAPAAAPILLNIVFITLLLFFLDRGPSPEHVLAIGVSAAGILQFLWLVWAAHRAGLRPRLPRPRLTPRVRRLLGLMAPGMIGAGVMQLNTVVDTILASTLKSGSVSYLFYADRLNQLPIGMIGVAIGIALLPLLSRQIAAGREAEAVRSQNKALELSMLLTLPAALALMVIPAPLIHAVFERGAFDSADTGATAAALAAYAAGLPAYVGVKVFAPGYFARKDVRTPMKIAAIAVAVNIVLNLILMRPFAHVGLAMATAFAAWVNVGLLMAGLIRRGEFAFERGSLSRLMRMALAGLAMAGAVYGLAVILDAAAVQGLWQKAGAAALLIGAGVALYFGFAGLLRAFDPSEVRRLLRRPEGGTHSNG